MSPLWLILLACKLFLTACFSALRAALLCCRYLHQDVHRINTVNRANKPPPNEIYNVGMLNCKQFMSLSSKPEGQCWTLSHQTVELIHAFSSGHLYEEKRQQKKLIYDISLSSNSHDSFLAFYKTVFFFSRKIKNRGKYLYGHSIPCNNEIVDCNGCLVTSNQDTAYVGKWISTLTNSTIKLRDNRSNFGTSLAE